MSWRPEGWTNPYLISKPLPVSAKDVNKTTAPSKLQNAQDYEWGADALLEALRKQNVTTPDVIHHYLIEKLGKIVFIPDDP